MERGGEVENFGNFLSVAGIESRAKQSECKQLQFIASCERFPSAETHLLMRHDN